MRHDDERPPIAGMVLAGIGAVALIDALRRHRKVKTGPKDRASVTVSMNSGTPGCAPEPVPMNGSGPITWILDESMQGYRFPATKAIVFDYAHGVFDPSQTVNERTVTVQDNFKAGMYKYTVNLIGPGNPPPIDPHVHNNSGLTWSRPPILDQLLQMLLGGPGNK